MENTLIKQKEEFVKILREKIKRDGIEDLINYLEKSDFFTAPASAKYHCDREGGLCEHSLNVYNRLHKIIFDEYGNFDTTRAWLPPCRCP